MTKADILYWLKFYDEDEEIDLLELEREILRDRAEQIEMLEEEQHASGFYAFQDKMDMWRYER